MYSLRGHHRPQRPKPVMLFPHLVQRRSLLAEAVHAALTVLHEAQAPPSRPSGNAQALPARCKRSEEHDEKKKIGWVLDVTHPWAALQTALNKGALQDDDPVDEVVGQAASGEEVMTIRLDKTRDVLRSILARVLTLAGQMSYTDKLDNGEAGVIPDFLERYSTTLNDAEPHATSRPAHPAGDDPLTRVLETAPLVLLRLVHYALYKGPDDMLNLSRLGPISSALDEFSMPSLCTQLGVPASAIKKLDVSYNVWETVPLFISSAFPNVTDIDITATGPIDHLPLSMLLLPITYLEVRGTKIDNPPSPIICPSLDAKRDPKHDPPTSSATPPAIGARPLVHILAKLYDDTLRTDCPPSELTDLPPHLLEMMEGMYRCELCAKHIYKGEAAWLEEEVERAWALQVGRIEERRCSREWHLPPSPPLYMSEQLVRLKGRACGACVEKHLKPSDHKWSRRWDPSQGRWGGGGR